MIPSQEKLCDAQEPLRLLDGSIVRVRPIRFDDTERLRALHARLSVDSIVHRFFAYVPVLSPGMAEQFTHVDGSSTMAYVATIGQGNAEQIIGVVRYVRLTDSSAEVAFTVEDRWQGHGIATALLYRLVRHARSHGFTTFVANIMEDNVAMLAVIQHCGIPYTLRHEQGDLLVTLDLTAQADSGWLTMPTISAS